MNYLNLSFENRKIIVTPHAKQRALQRARLLMTITEKQNLDLFLRKDFKISVMNPKIINCPFYQNKYSTKNGEGSLKTSSKLFDYYCSVKPDGAIVICTVTLKGKDS